MRGKPLIESANLSGPLSTMSRNPDAESFQVLTGFNPELAGLAMAFSSVSVLTSSTY